ncbi:mitochondrial carrier [Suhomyces tanzawaensis NRRL Y-17324]|uniref:Mitochondrial thiamine pyrophosphate carrier 1 n=1 Tax=Suhomyces tanzawaensis NRRL Y-17324 TaxID=984487 RepID=A0A1E4SHV5_9ASCO|nr:mitochondrial carrier [Suhomyces tanzawaensis NRRL Y-17324]ODV79060.1 mitochondrial carrier [Suhomyces tanzawaensis NRRL Y-17324]
MDGDAPKSKVSLSNRQIELISGLSAGFSTTIITHPLDLIKVRLQLSTNQPGKPFEALTNVFRKIHRDGFISSSLIRHYKLFHIMKQYYRGITPNLIGNISAWGLYFALYAEFKTHLRMSNETTNYFGSSMLAGISTSILTNPIWVLKTRILGTSRSQGAAYKSTVDGIRQILRDEGARSFWKGTIPSMFLVLQGSLQFTFYDHLKDFFDKRRGRADRKRQISTQEYLYSSAISKILSMVIMYPSQIVRSRLQFHTKLGVKVTISSTMRQLWENEGRIKAFYKGLSANVLRVVPATCITFLVYETVKDLLHSENEEQ